MLSEGFNPPLSERAVQKRYRIHFMILIRRNAAAVGCALPGCQRHADLRYHGSEAGFYARIAVTDVSDNPPIDAPLLVLRGIVVFPPSVVPVAVSRPAAIRLVDDAVTAGGVIAVSAQRDDDPEQCYAIGASARVHRLVRLHDGTLRIALQALERVAIEQITQREPYLRALARALPDRTDDPDLAAHAQEARKRARELLDALPPNEELRTQLDSADDPRHLAALLASMCLVRASLAERQTLLEIDDVGERLDRISALLTQELAILRGHLRM